VSLHNRLATIAMANGEGYSRPKRSAVAGCDIHEVAGTPLRNLPGKQVILQIAQSMQIKSAARAKIDRGTSQQHR
jgi:hypothetical protein